MAEATSGASRAPARHEEDGIDGRRRHDGPDGGHHRRELRHRTETAVALARAGATTVITARHTAGERPPWPTSRHARGGDRVDLVVFDLAGLASVREGAADLLARCRPDRRPREQRRLVLRIDSETVDGFEATFGVNHLGPFLLTELLLDRIKQSPGRGSSTWLPPPTRAPAGSRLRRYPVTRAYRAMQVYSKSKLANIYFTTELARRLEGTGVTVNCLHPGHGGHRVRPRRRLLGRARLRAEGHQALHAQRPQKGATHLGLPGVVT